MSTVESLRGSCFPIGTSVTLHVVTQRGMSCALVGGLTFSRSSKTRHPPTEKISYCNIELARQLLVRGRSNAVDSKVWNFVTTGKSTA